MLKKALAVVDVSGSMSGLPMVISVALGLVVSKLTSPPFYNKCITFSESPEWHQINGESLKDMIHDVKNMRWGANTDLLKVFEIILEEARTNNLAKERMIETLFVFTDMQFDSNMRFGEQWNTTYDTIKNMYEAEGYTVPKLVFWNLRASKPAIPCLKDTKGVAMVSGFSSDLLNLFMDDGDFTPETMMIKALEPYLPLVKLE